MSLVVGAVVTEHGMVGGSSQGQLQTASPSPTPRTRAVDSVVDCVRRYQSMTGLGEVEVAMVSPVPSMSPLES